MAQTEPATPDLAAALPAIVTRVIAGDTLDVHMRGVRTGVGYLGVETPPSNTPCGQMALERNRQLAASAVLLLPEPGLDLDDRARRLFYAYTEDGLSIDETLVREGLGLAARTQASHGAALLSLEADAAQEARGCLWGG
ncbi:MAG: thermonuclease family protein [Chloroflexi bacterium]|nr:thermonuclease family protein [Chloroflexota bacterium]